MSSSTRISLQDCLVDLQLPSPTLLASTPSTSAEEQTLLAASSHPHELTEAYIGDTLFLLLTITAPSTVSHSPESLYQSLDCFGDVTVTLGPDRSAARVCSLPVLRESSWIGTTRQLAIDPDAPQRKPATLLCKGLWVLIRTPPETSQLAPPLSVSGKQHIFVAIRQRSVSHTLRNSPVWATIDRASRLFGKAIALSASKPILVNLPLEIACRQVRVSHTADNAFVCITAKNATGDATLAIVPPYINVNHSRVVADPDVNPRTAKPDISGAVEVAKEDKDRGKMGDIGIPLDDHYEFVPMFASADPADDDEHSAEFGSGAPLELSRTHSSATSSSDDYGLFIPSFNYWQKQAVALGPREVFNFVYKVVQRGHNVVANDTAQGVEKKFSAKGKSGTIINKPLKLRPGTCLETSVAVSWNCMPREPSYDVPPSTTEKNDALQREMSAGGVLATGKRGNVAVRLTCVHWRPPTLIDGVVVAFSGPPVCVVGARLSVSVSVLNQTGVDLTSAAVRVQQSEDAALELVALRTVIAIGHIASGQETTLQLPCIALKPGTLSLGPVQVVDRSRPEDSRNVWTSQAAYEVFVVDPASPVPGDPEPPRSAVIVDRESEIVAR